MKLFASLAFLLALTAPALAQEEGGRREVPIYLDIQIAEVPEGTVIAPSETTVTLPGKAVKISGITSRDLAGKVLQVTVTPPQEPDPPTLEPESECPEDDDKPTAKTIGLFSPEKPTVLAAPVGPTGKFEVTFTPKATGTHEVEASEPEMAYRGRSEFEVGEIELEEDCEEVPQEEIEAEAAGLSEVICEAVDAIEARVGELPPSPAKDELEKKLKELDSEIKDAQPCGEAPRWANGTYHLGKLQKDVPQVRRATAPAVRRVKDWLRDARQARSEARKALIRITQGNVVCDQLDVIVNGLKFVDFYMGLLIKPASFLADWAKENVPTKLVGLIPAVNQTPAVKDTVELGWKGVTSYQPKLESGRIRITTKGFDRALAAGKMANGIASFAASRVFEAFCQTFQGPVEGAMTAEFVREGGRRIWWQYSIGITGQLILRYPKDAKGDVIALTGEFIGNAQSIKSWDNAVPVLFPGLAQGTVFRSLRIEPIVMDTIPRLFQKNLGASKSQSAPDFNPVKSIIDQGGVITQGVMTPAFFRVPVRAEMRGKTLRLELQKAAVDFDDLRVKVIQIVLPVLSLWPEVIDYALPYKGAHFIMTRAMNDGPVTFDIERQGEKMMISEVFTRKRETAETKGEYKLSVTACNPSC